MRVCTGTLVHYAQTSTQRMARPWCAVRAAARGVRVPADDRCDSRVFRHLPRPARLPPRPRGRHGHGQGVHRSTSQLNLSRFYNWKHPIYPTGSAYIELKSARMQVPGNGGGPCRLAAGGAGSEDGAGGVLPRCRD